MGGASLHVTVDVEHGDNAPPGPMAKALAAGRGVGAAGANVARANVPETLP